MMKRLLLIITEFAKYVISRSLIRFLRFFGISSLCLRDFCTVSFDPSEKADVFIINLKHRVDRRKSVLEEFSKLSNLRPRVFSAIKSNNGALGCTRSHIEIMENFLKSDSELLFISEDDIECNCDSDFFVNLIREFSLSKFDVCCLSSNPKYIFKSKSELKPALGIQTTAFYVVKKTRVLDLLRSFRRSEYLLKMGVPPKFAACDQQWIWLQLFKFRFCICKPSLFPQVESFSDIEKKTVAYYDARTKA